MRRLAEYVATSSLTVMPDESDLILTDDRAPVERLTDRQAQRECRSILGE